MKSIALKLWTGMMTLVVIVIVLLWLFQIVFLERFYTEMRTSDIKKESYKIIELLSNEQNLEFQEQLDAFVYKNNINMEVIDLNGNMIYTKGTSGQMHMMKNNLRGEVIQQAATGKERIAQYSHPRFGYRFILMGLPIKVSGKLIGVMMIDMPMAPVEDAISILKRQLYYITAILFTAALFISFFLSKGFTRPILDIKRVSETMASGDFSARLTSEKQDEIGQLAETINHLGEQLSKIEQLRKELIANVSHELRTPLSLIRGYAETIRDITGDIPEKREKQIGIIIEESERLREIVDDILNLSQLQSGCYELNIRKFPINETIDHIINKYELLFHKKGIQVQKLGFDQILVEADEGKIAQVLSNLINNGFKHTESDGSITVSLLRKNPGVVHVEVIDTGRGIPEEEIVHIWDRYYKAENARSSDAVGTGLGLAIVKGVLEAHTAPYGVKSQMGVGTTFWFDLKEASAS
jgi:signal transduction histidine kinase